MILNMSYLHFTSQRLIFRPGFFPLKKPTQDSITKDDVQSRKRASLDVLCQIAVPNNWKQPCSETTQNARKFPEIGRSGNLSTQPLSERARRSAGVTLALAAALGLEPQGFYLPWPFNFRGEILDNQGSFGV